MLSRPFLSGVAALLGLAGASSAAALPAGEILHELRSFARTGRVLYIAAHPDDENTRLITYFARGRGYRTGYLSMTRGDGGQNLIGTELRDALGIIRTQELLAARRIDGGVQFFTRANDFGFSKTPEETLLQWDRDEMLKDMVRVIRTFRPDVLITRFSPEPSGTHAHHTASAMLAIDAFRLAGDASAYPEHLADLAPWQPRRVWWNTGGQGQSTENMLTVDVGGYDPLRGESFGEIAARSRTMHKSQGFGALGSRGVAMERFRLLAGDPASDDPMAGIDTTWNRVPGGAEIGPLAQAAADAFDPRRPAASVPALLALRRQLAALPPSPLLGEKREQLDRIIVATLGLDAMTTLPDAAVVPGETITLRHTAIVRNDYPVTWRAVRHTGAPTEGIPSQPLAHNRSATAEASATIPADAALSHPYWLRTTGTTGRFAVDDDSLIGRPDNPPEVPVTFEFDVDGQTIAVETHPVQVILDPVRGEIRRPLRIVAPVTVSFAEELQVFAPGEQRTIHLDLGATRAGAAGVARLEVPEGWTVSPAEHPFQLGDAGATARLAFAVTPPAAPGTAALRAHAEVNGQRFGHRRAEIAYDHIPAQVLQPRAELKAVNLQLAIGGRRVGYLPGAGDLVAEALVRMGFEVKTLGLSELTRDRLREFDAVVLGVRALNTVAGIGARLPALFGYAEDGGTVVVQYNTNNPMPNGAIAPYPLRLSRDRVTEEDAAVTLLAPEHPALTRPNRITPADFDGWVQERGLYFPDHWDARYTALLSSADTGEPQRSGALLVAPHGSGWFVYTGLSFFRQLPEGVPGAFRLFANLVSLSSPEQQ